MKYCSKRGQDFMNEKLIFHVVQYQKAKKEYDKFCEQHIGHVVHSKDADLECELRSKLGKAEATILRYVTDQYSEK